MIRRSLLLVVLLGAILIPATGVSFFLLSSTGTPPGTGITTNNAFAGRETITVTYNGTSYRVPAKSANSPSFGCPPGTDPASCQLLAQTCGNGVGADAEPWKNCVNCPFDAGCSGAQLCNAQTGQCHVPGTACQVAVYNQQH